jgi:hypothetical protein
VIQTFGSVNARYRSLDHEIELLLTIASSGSAQTWSRQLISLKSCRARQLLL